MLETLLKRDRAVVLAGLVGATALAWLYLVLMAAGMNGMSGAGGGMASMFDMAATQIKPWAALDFVLMALMWAIMMVAMMVPSAAPMILLYARVRERQRERGHELAPVSAFVAGYLAIWTAFSLAATLLQWGLTQGAVLSPMMVSASPYLSGALLIAAGIYQWTPLKGACLKHCRSPIEFLSRSWRPGAGGAFVMGLHHGTFCLGCCWVLMALLFVGGVMNLLWVAAIAVFVLVEKVSPFGVVTGRITGILLVLGGIYMLISAQ